LTYALDNDPLACVDAEQAYRPAEQFGAAATELIHRLYSVSYEEMPANVRARLELALLDLAGVSLGGMRTPELAALVAAARPEPGHHPLLGTGRTVGPVDSAWFPAVAAACLELDEGNKHAVGHPAAHVFFTALAAARASDERITGQRLLAAVAGGYELAARIGRCLRRDSRWHTHGHWGVLGAAFAAARVLGLDADQSARAVGAAGSLMRVAPWQAVLEGDFTRNLWMADAVPAGLRAAELAAGGLAPPLASAYAGLSLIGEVDIPAITREPTRWLCGEGYLKLHSACSYTHPAVDLVLALRDELPSATSVHVRTGSLSAPLLHRNADSRLSAMFSLPFVVATAWRHGEVTPQVMDPEGGAFARSSTLVDRVDVEVDENLDRWLPDRRVTEVTMSDGTHSIALAAPNPIGDADHFPLDAADVRAKLVRLVGAPDAGRIERTMGSLPSSTDVAGHLAELP
jgi:2-methylcitrate dehydratase PrpD